MKQSRFAGSNPSFSGDGQKAGDVVNWGSAQTVVLTEANYNITSRHENTGDCVVTLPPPKLAFIGSEITFEKRGTGLLRTVPSGAARIDDDPEGNGLENTTDEVHASITYRLISLTEWAVIVTVGTWTAYVPALPDGLIIALNSVTVPSGWTRLFAADGRYLVAAGGSYAAQATGGDNSISGNTTANGLHTGTSDTFARNVSSAQVSVEYHIGAAGEHSHPYSLDIVPAYQDLLLIRADGAKAEMPADAVVFTDADENPGNMTIFAENNRMLRGNSAIATADDAVSGLILGDAGTHAHCGMSQYVNTGAATPRYLLAGNHNNHSLGSVSLTNTIKRAFLRAWTKASAFDPTHGIIAMWDGASLPAGWVLCDGDNGTTDLRDCFIVVSDAGNAGNVDGDNTIDISASLGSGGLHNHEGDYSTANPISTGHTADEGAHTHEISETGKAFVPEYYALKFIQLA